MGGQDGKQPAPPILEKIRHGTQHHTLVSRAGTMRRRGMNATEIEAALQVVNRDRCERPGEPEAIRKIAQSMERYAPGAVPRQLPEADAADLEALLEEADGADAQARPGCLVALARALAASELTPVELDACAERVKAGGLAGKGAFLETMREAMKARDAAGRAAVSDSESQPLYQETPDGMVLNRPTAHGVVSSILTNFRARIVADMTCDDGEETRRQFEIEATLGGFQRRFTVPSGRFAGMDWATEHLGAGAIVSAGMGKRDQARAAIEHLSGTPPSRTIYSHTGWRRLRVGERNLWVYLHAGGAIGPDGSVAGVEVELPEGLRPFWLPPIPGPEDMRHAIRASLELGNLSVKGWITIPVRNLTYRAAIGGSDFSGHLRGPTCICPAPGAARRTPWRRSPRRRRTPCSSSTTSAAPARRRMPPATPQQGGPRAAGAGQSERAAADALGRIPAGPEAAARDHPLHGRGHPPRPVPAEPPPQHRGGPR